MTLPGQDDLTQEVLAELEQRVAERPFSDWKWRKV